MKVFPFDHFISMNENTIGIPSTVKANHIAYELTVGGWGRITQFGKRASARQFQANLGKASQPGLTISEENGEP